MEKGKTYLLESKYNELDVASPENEKLYWIQPLDEEMWEWGGTIPFTELQQEIIEGEYKIIREIKGEWGINNIDTIVNELIKEGNNPEDVHRAKMECGSIVDWIIHNKRFSTDEARDNYIKAILLDKLHI